MKNEVIITKEQFLASSLNNISQVYYGKRHHCRCGCGGDYTATSFMKGARSGIDDSLVQKRLRRAKRLVEKGADVMYGSTWVDIETADNRSLTFYFDEV